MFARGIGLFAGGLHVGGSVQYSGASEVCACEGDVVMSVKEGVPLGWAIRAVLGVGESVKDGPEVVSDGVWGRFKDVIVCFLEAILIYR